MLERPGPSVGDFFQLLHLGSGSVTAVLAVLIYFRLGDLTKRVDRIEERLDTKKWH